MDIKETLEKILKNFTSAPFLFIGSGLSRRYIGLEDWKGLLQKFCSDNGLNFDYYYSTSNSNLPKTAKLLAKDFSEIWWKNDKFLDSRNEYKAYGIMEHESSPLKYEICKYLKTKSIIDDQELKNEVEELKKANIDGIITTNWDNFIEGLFQDYDVYFSQDDLINSIVQEIGEIYKIHGSVDDFNTLILTDEDYDSFTKKNAYLAAKLLSIFIEHPIFFLGYSISDSNIQEILKSIATCISHEGLKKLENSIFLVEPIFDGSSDIIEKSYINIDGSNLPITHIYVKDYSIIYKTLQLYKRKLSVKHLKQIKTQLYEIVKNNDPHDRVALIDIEKNDDIIDVDFVIGVGMKSLHEKGMVGLNRDDIIEDIIFNTGGYDPNDLLTYAFPQILKYQRRTPLYKYLKLGNKLSDIQNNKLDWRIKKYYKLIDEDINNPNVTVRSMLIKNEPISYSYNISDANYLKAAIRKNGKSSIDNGKLLSLLKEKFSNYKEEVAKANPPIFCSHYRTTVRIYDWLEYSD